MRLTICILYYLWMLPIVLVHGHLPEYMSTPAQQLHQLLCCHNDNTEVDEAVAEVDLNVGQYLAVNDHLLRDKIDQFCVLAEKCIHDTVPVCGRSGDEFRTFLDTCDMLEFACDSNQVFTHIEDTGTCPVSRKIPSFL